MTRLFSSSIRKWKTILTNLIKSLAYTNRSIRSSINSKIRVSFNQQVAQILEVNHHQSSVQNVFHRRSWLNMVTLVWVHLLEYHTTKLIYWRIILSRNPMTKTLKKAKRRKSRLQINQMISSKTHIWWTVKKRALTWILLMHLDRDRRWSKILTKETATTSYTKVQLTILALQSANHRVRVSKSIS